MVKFQKHLENQLTPEWKAMYCDYKQLKKDIRNIKAHLCQVPKPTRLVASDQNFMIVHKESSDFEAEVYRTELAGSYQEFEKNFFLRLDSQFNKISSFYKFKEDEYSTQALKLQSQMKALFSSQKPYRLHEFESSPRELKRCPNISKNLAEKLLKAAFVEYYRGLELLRNYSALNMLSFVKILKKYDKVTGRSVSPNYLQAVKGSYFLASTKIVDFMDRVEGVFTEHFVKGNRKEAMAHLRPMQQTDTVNFVLGVSTGWSWSLLGAFVYILVRSDIAILGSQPFTVFSTLGLFVLHLYLYGLSLYLSSKVRINYKLIFETELKHQDVLLISTGLTTLVTLGMIFSVTMPISAKVIALALIVAFLVLLFCPANIFYRSARSAFLRYTWRAFSSPFFKVSFADFFLADQLTSQVPALRNVAYISCYYVNRLFENRTDACTNGSIFRLFQYVISALPYWWRLMQCWKRWRDEHDKAHIANGGKYLSAVVAVVLRLTYVNVHSEVWLVAFVATSVVATIYQLYWDIVVDWGFLRRHSVNPWLRDELVLKTKHIYYISMVANIIIRLEWIYRSVSFRNKDMEYMTTEFILASLEVLRRGHWNFYRLENEHVNNVKKYRAERAVPLPFIYMDDSFEGQSYLSEKDPVNSLSLS